MKKRVKFYAQTHGNFIMFKKSSIIFLLFSVNYGIILQYKKYEHIKFLKKS
ncbi:MAG: hypothetical protein US74_C0004G0023 [Parcubacteria group bacterium GW2011_GWA2_38_13]|nr:MAG: hypothetical protein US74_C0004G0023 [Parcubacteria group bacterium GW2011_GWA2_38_13]